jgi:hypothetical protein
MPVMTEAEFNKKYPYGSYGGYLAGMREKAARAAGLQLLPAFDPVAFVAAADENRAAGRSND